VLLLRLRRGNISPISLIAAESTKDATVEHRDANPLMPAVTSLHTETISKRDRGDVAYFVCKGPVKWRYWVVRAVKVDHVGLPLCGIGGGNVFPPPKPDKGLFLPSRRLKKTLFQLLCVPSEDVGGCREMVVSVIVSDEVLP
jgi:hypothetical protein